MQMNRIGRRGWVAAAAALGVTAAAALVPLSALSADTGTVNAQVVAGATACITVTSPTNGASVSFGSLAFSATPGSSQGSGSPDITVANCSTGSESVLASGTNATGASSTWALVGALANQCGNSLNQYRLGVRDANNTDLFLTAQNQTLGSVAANGALTRIPRITMPCTGSSGNGQTMSMSFNFTATVP
jgi:hypothetical protein